MITWFWCFNFLKIIYNTSFNDIANDEKAIIILVFAQSNIRDNISHQRYYAISKIKIMFKFIINIK